VTGRLVDAAAIAERLSVPKSWILESARSGAMPCVRLGRYVRFDEEDVDRWLESCRQPGRPIAFRQSPKAST
jgi:excisionase family DNA binding protein